MGRKKHALALVLLAHEAMPCLNGDSRYRHGRVVSLRQEGQLDLKKQDMAPEGFSCAQHKPMGIVHPAQSNATHIRPFEGFLPLCKVIF
jgi:hypothetical protein